MPRKVRKTKKRHSLLNRKKKKSRKRRYVRSRKQYGGVNSDEGNPTLRLKTDGVSGNYEQERSSSLNTVDPGVVSPGVVSPGVVDPVVVDPVVVDPVVVYPTHISTLTPSAPPPYVMHTGPSNLPRLPYGYSRERSGLFRTPSNRLRSMYPVMGNYLERPPKLPITDDIKNKEVKIIGAHGQIKKDNWFLIPDGVKIITFSSMGCSVRGEADKSHLEPILELYLSGGSLFKDNDEKEKEKTVEMDEILKSFSERGSHSNHNIYNYDYKLHKENTIFPETIIYLDGNGCGVESEKDINCGIITFNKLTCRSLTDTQKINEEIIHFIPETVTESIKLSQLIKILGKGIYILFTCRVFDIVETMNTPFKEKFYRDLDTGRHKYRNDLIEKSHDVITFNITINEDYEKKESIRNFLEKALPEKYEVPIERINFFKEIYAYYRGEIYESTSFNILYKKFRPLYPDVGDLFTLNKTIFSLLDVGRGLKLVGDKHCFDRNEQEINGIMVPQFVKYLILKYAVLKSIV